MVFIIRQAIPTGRQAAGRLSERSIGVRKADRTSGAALANAAVVFDGDLDEPVCRDGDGLGDRRGRHAWERSRGS